MKIAILCNLDLASNVALNYLLAGLKKHQVRLFFSDNIGGSTRPIPQPLLDLKFFEQQLFNEIVFPAVDAQSSINKAHKSAPQYLTFAALANQCGSPMQSLNDVNQPSGLAKLQQSGAQLILSVRFGKILQAAAIAIPKHGVINLHSGLLPQYRGVMPTFWAMLNQQQHYGCSLHYIENAAIDAGAIISQSRQVLDRSKSYLENVLQLYIAGCQQMLDAVERICANKSLDLCAQAGDPQYFTFPDQQQLEAFHRLKMKLFDPEQVMQLVKAYQSHNLE